MSPVIELTAILWPSQERDTASGHSDDEPTSVLMTFKVFPNLHDSLTIRGHSTQ